MAKRYTVGTPEKQPTAIPQPDVCICRHTLQQHRLDATCAICNCTNYVKLIEVHPETAMPPVQELPATTELRRFNNNFEWMMNAAWPKVAQTLAELTITLNELNRILSPFLPKVADLTSRGKT